MGRWAMRGAGRCLARHATWACSGWAHAAGCALLWRGAAVACAVVTRWEVLVLAGARWEVLVQGAAL
ncbi:hypothetical protein ACOSP7_026786 [Xanthoceras sorbifolium]